MILLLYILAYVAVTWGLPALILHLCFDLPVSMSLLFGFFSGQLISLILSSLVWLTKARRRAVRKKPVQTAE